MSDITTTPKRRMTRKQKRLLTIAGLAVVLALAMTLILVALRDQIVFFYSPSEIAEKAIKVGEPIRLGGLVKADSWTKAGQVQTFIITDGETDMLTRFDGLPPDLFREGQGVVAEGSVALDGSFAATRIMAKHDENYMPKEVVEALKARGEWKPEAQGLAP